MIDLMIIIVEQGLKSLETAERVKKLASDLGISKIVCVINKISNKKENFMTHKLNEMDFELIGSIPEDEDVIKSYMEGQPLIKYSDSTAFKSIEKIAENILN